MNIYSHGMDVLGASAADFAPWLKIVGGVAQGLGGILGPEGKSDKESKEALKKAVEEAVEKEKAKLAAEKAKADAARTRLILYSVLGAVGVGGLVFLLRRKK